MHRAQLRHAQARVIDFRNRRANNRFLAVRELKLTGLRTPNYNRRADLVCFVNGLPLVFIELKAVYKNIRAGFDGNLRDYMDENVIAHAFHHNAFLIVSNGAPRPLWLHHQHVGALRRMEAPGRERQGQRGGRGAAQRHAGQGPAAGHCWRTSSCSTPARPGDVRKVVARNHQVLGVNQAVASVVRQEALKREFPPASG